MNVTQNKKKQKKTKKTYTTAKNHTPLPRSRGLSSVWTARTFYNYKRQALDAINLGKRVKYYEIMGCFHYFESSQLLKETYQNHTSKYTST